MAETPEISVAVCTYNRADVLPKCLESLTNQNIGSDLFEVLIIDNNSTDNTKKIADDFYEKYNNFRYVFETRQGHSQARNRAIAEAKGKYLAYIDDDETVNREFIQSILACFNETNADVVGGRLLSWIDSAEVPIFYNPRLYDFDLGSERKQMQSSGFDFGFGCGYSCFKKSLFDEVGLFSENFGIVNGKLQMGEDSEMGYRLLKAGKVFYYEPKMEVKHKLRLKELEFIGSLKRSCNVGSGIGKIIRNDITLSKKFKKIAAPFVYAFLFLFLFPFYWIKGPWFFAKKLGDVFFAFGVAKNVL
ncbi:glycosyltransferase family 2 protein [bacterium]|nr:glycosyltransferase family 2 protein [bacterium]